MVIHLPLYRIAILWLFPFGCFGSGNPIRNDSSHTYFHVGIDLGKTLYTFPYSPSRSGYTLEGLIRGGLAEKGKMTPGFFLSSGYSDFQSNKVYHNVSYRSQGYYGKIGFELTFKNDGENTVRNYVGFNLVATRVRDYSNFRIPGNYFEDYSHSIKTERDIFGLQPNFVLEFNVWKSLIISAGVQVTRLLKSAETNRVNAVSYYYPGMGVTKGKPYTFGLTLQLLLKIK